MSAKDWSFGAAGANRLLSSEYVVGPIAVRSAGTCLPAATELAVK